MKRLILSTLLLALVLPAAAQSAPPFPTRLEKQLAAKATNYTEVSLDKHMLAFASQFMDKSDKDEQAKHLIQNLNGVYVRTYEFAKPGAYTSADLQEILHHLSSDDGWVPMVSEHSNHGAEDSDVYMKMSHGQAVGMFVLSAEPTELNMVYISGPINPQDLSDLSGNFGIPQVHVPAHTPNAEGHQ